MNKFFENNALTDIAIILNLQYNWSQDNVPELVEHFFKQYQVLDNVEWLRGADLDAIRFKWQRYDFTLHFERYGQSIWIDCSEIKSVTLLAELYEKIIDA